MSKMNLEQVHAAELRMLIKFAEICERHNLRYYLAGGTLLGAIRHKGFIPWDDDIDILMPRPDYDELRKYISEVEENSDYYLASYELGNLNSPICKIFDKKTHIHTTNYTDPLEVNLWIDILPLDGLPEDDRIVDKLFKRSLFWRKLLKIEKANVERSSTKVKRIIKPAVKTVLSLIGPKRTAGMIDHISRTYKVDECDYIGGVAMGYGSQEKMPKEEYLKPVKVMFEGYEFNAPACWDYYLKRLYGDYMKLPPEDKQIAHLMEITMDD